MLVQATKLKIYHEIERMSTRNEVATTYSDTETSITQRPEIERRDRIPLYTGVRYIRYNCCAFSSTRRENTQNKEGEGTTEGGEEHAGTEGEGGRAGRDRGRTMQGHHTNSICNDESSLLIKSLSTRNELFIQL